MRLIPIVIHSMRALKSSTSPPLLFSLVSITLRFALADSSSITSCTAIEAVSQDARLVFSSRSVRPDP